MTIATITATYQRCDASGDQCKIYHKVNVEVARVLYPEYCARVLKQESLHQEFLRSGWYLKQFEWNPN